MLALTISTSVRATWPDRVLAILQTVEDIDKFGNALYKSAVLLIITLYLVCDLSTRQEADGMRRRVDSDDCRGLRSGAVAVIRFDITEIQLRGSDGALSLRFIQLSVS